MERERFVPRSTSARENQRRGTGKGIATGATLTPETKEGWLKPKGEKTKEYKWVKRFDAADGGVKL